jgi:hypothetical protein
MHTDTDATTYDLVRYAVEDPRTPAYGQTATGYGSKLPTRYRVRLASDDPTARLRRVYAMCYGNAASLYVLVKGEPVFIHDTDLGSALGR